MSQDINSENEISIPETKVKPTWYWIRDSKGYGSVTVTFVTVAFWVTTFSYLLSIVEKIGPLQIRAFDSSACAAYFIPILTLYFGRKATEAKFSTNQQTAVNNPSLKGGA